MTRRSTARLGLLLVAALLVGACGSNLSEEDKARANGAFQVSGEEAVAAGRSAGATDAGADTAASPASPGLTAGVPGGADGTGTAAPAGGSVDAGGGAVSSGAPVQGCPAGAGGQEIVLGTFGTEGGVIGANVATAPVGIRAWVADVNARGGLCGHPVRVVFGGNDNGDPAAAQAIARRLIEEEGVVAFYSTYSPTGMPVVYDVLEQAGIPVIADTSQVDPGDTSPMSFKPAASLSASGFGFGAAFATQTPFRKVAVLYLSEVSSATVSVQNIRDGAAYFGYEIVYEAAVSLASPDFTAQMTEARSRGADVVVGVVDFTTMTKIIRSAQRQGYNPQFSGSLAFVVEAVKAASAEFEGVTAFAPTANYRTPQLAEFRDAVAAYVPRGELGMLGPVAWAGGKLLERIAPQLDADPSSSELIEALYSVQNETLGGIVPPFSFTNTGGSPYLPTCVQPVRFVGGEWTQPLGDDFFACRP